MSTRIAIVVYDGVDELDAIGPYEVLTNAAKAGANAEVRLVTLDGAGEVSGSHGLVFRTHGRLEGSPDVVVVPGGGWNDRSERGAWSEAERGELPRRLAELAEGDTLLTSVCTGGMLLASAGVLEGRRAITHQGAVAELAERGTKVVDARVVDDGDVVTAGGVTSGIDLALHLVERLFGAEIAEVVATEIEHDRVTAVVRRPD
jgi:transcriptional regulator GlxA family with amidase domain